ncbi:MAG: DNA polymerase III subunit delta [Arenicellales bacterium]|nr:DNA polymerase III subunit delta [Arenicellales bacterium]
MRIASPALAGRLGKGLDKVYLLFGAESLLVEESADAIRAAARQDGVDEVLRYTAGVDLDWQQILAAGQALSLFASARLFEIRLPTGKPGDAGARVLTDFLANSDASTHLVLILGRVDKSTQSSKWFKTLESQGTAVEARAVSPAQLPGWIDQRLRAQGIKATPGAIERLAYYSEGNLLFAAQEINKLPLLIDPDRELDENSLESLVSDQARFSVFALVDAALAGNTAYALRMLHGLRREGSEAILVSWALARETRTLYQMALEMAGGADRQSVYQRYRVWRSRMACISAALARLDTGQWRYLLHQLVITDQVLKGQRQAPGGVWAELERAILVLCGIKPLESKYVINH